MLSRRIHVWSSLALAALLFAGLNIFVDAYFTGARLDLTRNGQYTLSPGTRAVIAGLPEPVTLRFYFSKKDVAQFPLTAAYARRVRDLLGEYADRAHGKILIQDIDPEAFTPEEDEAQAAGLSAAPTQNGDSVYFGLEGTNSLDQKNVIAYFAPDREAHLEYDLTALLYRLSHPQKPKLAVLSALPLTGSPANSNQPLAIYADLQQNYDLTTLAPDFSALPAGTNILLIAQPPALSPVQAKTIETFLLHGGRALIFVDPLSELGRQAGNPAAAMSSDLPLLFKGLGVAYDPAKVLLDRGLAQRIATSELPGQSSVAYPLWLHVTPANAAPRDPVTANIQNLNLASSGVLSPAPGAATRFEPLIRSSTDASLTPRARILMMSDPGSLMKQIAPTGKPFTIAARISGRANFAGTGAGNVNVIVAADADLFDDRFWVRGQPGGPVQPFADNDGFILGAVENLSGSDDLISLRLRANSDRPFTVVQALEASADLKFRETLQTLQTRLSTSQAQIAQLQQAGATPQQAAAISRLRADIAATRNELRNVQRSLRADIDRLGNVLAFINILLMPLLVAAFALVLASIRRRRRA